MRRHRLLAAPALAVAGLLVLAGCSDGGTRSLGPVPTAPTTTPTTVPVSSTVPPTTSAPVTTVRGPTTPAPTTTAAPVLRDGIPQVTATPSRAPIGSRVRIEGTGFTDEMWRNTENLWLARSGIPSCSLYAEVEHTVTVSPSGRLTGEFVVPITGGCRMSDRADVVTAGSYAIAFTCTACFIGTFEVTSTATRCANVGFVPNTDDVAGDIVAAGLGCAEAEALVRTVGTQVGASGGPSRVESGGFVCVRTFESSPVSDGLPSSSFACTSGTRTVTFNRT